jgi:hypothetical protein
MNSSRNSMCVIVTFFDLYHYVLARSVFIVVNVCEKNDLEKQWQ